MKRDNKGLNKGLKIMKYIAFTILVILVLFCLVRANQSEREVYLQFHEAYKQLSTLCEATYGSGVIVITSDLDNYQGFEFNCIADIVNITDDGRILLLENERDI